MERAYIHLRGPLEERLQKLAFALCFSEDSHRPLCLLWELTPLYPTRVDAILNIESLPYGTTIEYTRNQQEKYNVLGCSDEQTRIRWLRTLKPSFLLTMILETRYRFLDTSVRIGVHIEKTDSVDAFLAKLKVQPSEMYFLVVADHPFLCEELVQVLGGRCSFLYSYDPTAFFVLSSCPRLLSSPSSSLCRLVSEYANSVWEHVD
jgi:hypothetical protein